MMRVSLICLMLWTASAAVGPARPAWAGPRPTFLKLTEPGPAAHELAETKPATGADKPAVAKPAAIADRPASAKKSTGRAWELIGLLGLGGAPFSAISGRQPNQTMPFTFYHALRLRFPKWTPLALEVNTVYAGAFGLGLNILCDVFRSERVRVHLGDPGVFFNLYQSVTARNWDRTIDLTAGLGVEIRPVLTGPRQNLRLTFDARWFVPNPFTTHEKLGSFAIPLYEDAAKGVQLWIGIARTF